MLLKKRWASRALLCYSDINTLPPPEGGERLNNSLACTELKAMNNAPEDSTLASVHTTAVLTNVD